MLTHGSFVSDLFFHSLHARVCWLNSKRSYQLQNIVLHHCSLVCSVLEHYMCMCRIFEIRAQIVYHAHLSLTDSSIMKSVVKLSDKCRFTEDERLLLHVVFTYNKHPSPATIKELSQKLLVSKDKVKNWFKARRCQLSRANPLSKLPHRKSITEYFFTQTIYTSFLHELITGL